MKRLKVREGTEDNPRFKMMEAGITLKEIEKWYGKETAKALVQYCDKTGKSIDEVAGSDREWDKFEMASKGKKRGLGTNSKKFDNWGSAARLDEPTTGRSKRATRFYDRPVDADIYGEGSGSRMDEYAIAENIGEYIRDCEWAEDFNWGDYSDMTFEVGGFGYRVTVTKEFAPGPEEL